MRAQKIREESEHLQQIERMVKDMEGPQRHGIEQLRQEITRVQSDLQGWHATKKEADGELEAATAELQKLQEMKRGVSERLFDLLMDSEEVRMEKLASIETTLNTLRVEDVVTLPRKVDSSGELVLAPGRS